MWFHPIIYYSCFIVVAKASIDNLLHVGCFKFPSSNSEVSLEYKLANISGDSAVQCVELCRYDGYQYAGVQDPSECRCGRQFKGTPSKKCDKRCYPDASNMCGGALAISVYETASSVPGSPAKFSIINSTSSGIYLSWAPPVFDGRSPVMQYKIKATPLTSETGQKIPGSKEWDFSKHINSAWIYGVHPATKYLLEIRASNTIGLGDPKSVEGWTTIDEPPIPLQPEIMSRTSTTITVKLHPVSSMNGPITAYHIVVIDESVSVIMDPDVLTDYYNASQLKLPYYIAASFDAKFLENVFTVGDGKSYGGYQNAPLIPNIDYHVLLGAVSSLNKTLASYSVSDHDQHTSSHLFNFHAKDSHYSHSNRVADKISDHMGGGEHDHHNEEGGIAVGLVISVSIVACLVFFAFVIYVGLRVFLRAPKRSELQELTVNSYDNGGLSVEGMGHFFPDDDLPDHYSRLKQKVAVMAPADVTIVGDIGIGTFGAVRKGNQRSNPKVHSSNQSSSCVLVHHILDSSLDPPNKAAMLRSLGQHVTAAQHKHVVSLLGLVEEVAAVSVVFEYHTQTLKQQLTDARALTHYPVYADKHRRFSTISEQQIYTILSGVARGLQWLRCCGIAHGAVCARNIVLVDGTVPKLTGFGLLHYNNELYVPDYRRWMARELLTHSSTTASTQEGGDRGQSAVANGLRKHELVFPNHTVASLQGDIWSYGVLVWECVTLGGTPYPELRSDELTGRIQTGLRLPQPQYVDTDLYQLMIDCWQLDPGERTGFPQLESQMNQLMGEGSHLLFATYPGFQYQLYAPHLEFME